MFFNLLKYEFKYLLNKYSTYVYAFIFFAIGFLIMNGMGGAFTGVRVGAQGGAEQSFTNSSMIIMLITSALNTFLILFVGGYLSDILLKDFNHNTFQLVYTKQVKKATLFSVRIIAGITTIIGMFSFLSIGLIIGRFSPWLEQGQFQPFNISYYTKPFLYISISNIFIATSLFVLVSIVTKKKLYVNLSAVMMYVVYSLLQTLGQKLDLKEITALADPFGLSALGLMTENLSVAQQNTHILQLNSYVLYNRLIWIAIALVTYFISFKLYKFSYPSDKKKSKKETEEKVEKASYKHVSNIALDWGLLGMFNQFKHYFLIEVKILFKSTMFKVFTSIYIIFVVIAFANQNVIYDTAVLPVTYTVVEGLLGLLNGFAIMFIAIFSGELVWKSRNSRCHIFEDVAPFNSSIRVFSHLVTLLLYIGFFWVLGSVCGIGFQLFKGFYNIDLGLYITYGGFALLYSFLYIALALFIQALAPNRLAAMLIIFGISIAKGYLSTLGLEHTLWHLFSSSRMVYSDMNGFGNFLPKYFIYKLYWGGFASILLLFASRFYRRGSEHKLLFKVKGLRFEWTKLEVISLVLFIGMYVTGGSIIFYNTNILNDYQTKKERREASVQYEKDYKYLETLAQPRVTDVDLNVQFFPEELALNVSGELVLKNKNTTAIDTLLFYIAESDDAITYDLTIGYTELEHNTDVGLYLLKLDTPLLPNEEFKFTFSEEHPHQGYETDTSVCGNGSFINSSMFMPAFGYSDSYELASNELRKKYDLEPKERMADVDDLEARGNTYISSDSDWVNFRATVGTTEDQIAVAPGYLQNSWIENGRKQFVYEMDMPILKFFSFVSARYEIATDKWISATGKEVLLQVYHHDGHDYNIDSMMKALKMGLTHYSDKFIEYPHKQVRILEFPRYATFAQSFPNTIPYSEGIGFIADVDKEKDQDYPFFVTAHELAHQWWAHIVIGANVRGAVLMSEALAQYSALTVMEQEYGEVKMGSFLRQELNSYLLGRGSETSKEMPLSKVENQQYIHYNKGSVVMFALKGYIGATKVDSALAEVVDKYKYQEAPYINSTEFLECIYKQVPDSLSQFVTEMFEDIVLYDNSIKEVVTTKIGDKYRVDMTLECLKVRADSIGNEIKIEMNDWVELLVFDEKHINGKKIKTIINKNNRMFKLKSGVNEISIMVDSEPVEAGIDPLFKLLDKTIYNNTKTISDIKEG